MNFLRNTLAIIVGLGIAGLIITLGIRVFPQWVTFDAFAPFEHWQRFLQSMKDNEAFFGFLLFISGLGTTIGGVATAIIVKYAKVAYAILIGFIMLFIAMLDVVIFPYHPTFYKISIFMTFFPFSWIGGKIVEVLYERSKKKRIAEKMNKSK
jgi:predicted MFS family arabinose efflux permease